MPYPSLHLPLKTVHGQRRDRISHISYLLSAAVRLSDNTPLPPCALWEVSPHTAAQSPFSLSALRQYNPNCWLSPFHLLKVSTRDYIDSYYQRTTHYILWLSPVPTAFHRQKTRNSGKHILPHAAPAAHPCQEKPNHWHKMNRRSAGLSSRRRMRNIFLLPHRHIMFYGQNFPHNNRISRLEVPQASTGLPSPRWNRPAYYPNCESHPSTL